MWFASRVVADPSEAADPRIYLIDCADLAGLAPATFVMAVIDTLQSEGEILAERLAAAGVEVEAMTYSGVVHELFGMGAVVPKAKEAVDMANAVLRPEGGDPMAADAAAPAEDATGGVTDVEPIAAETPEAVDAEPMADEPAAEAVEGEVTQDS